MMARRVSFACERLQEEPPEVSPEGFGVCCREREESVRPHIPARPATRAGAVTTCPVLQAKHPPRSARTSLRRD